MTQEKEYTPNFDDPRVIKKIRRAIGFAHSCVSHIKDTPVSQKVLQKYVGQLQHDLAKYLRSTIFICTNEYYSIDNGISKKYIRNVEGIKFLLSKLPKDNIAESIPAEKLMDVSVSLIEEEYDQELQDLVDGNVKYVLKSNRYFTNIQNIARDVKKIVLAKHGFKHQYDIECSAPTLLYQYAQKNGLDEFLFGMHRYLNNRSEVRKELAELIDVDIQTIKKIINSMFNGAKIGASDYFEIYKTLNGDIDKINKFKNSHFIQLLKSDISKMWKVLSNTVMYRNRKHYEDGSSRLLCISSKQKWNVYFELERKVLDSVISFLKFTDNRVFLEHDGWSSLKEINQQELIDHIYTITGYTVKLSYEFIPTEKPLESSEHTGKRTIVYNNSDQQINSNSYDESLYKPVIIETNYWVKPTNFDKKVLQNEEST